MYRNILTDKKGFVISALLYPAFIIIITITVLVLITLIQSSFSMNKLTTELQGDMTDNNTMKSLKENAEEVLNDSKNKITWSGDSENKINLYDVTEGKIKLINKNGDLQDSNLTVQVNTTNWKGRFFTKEDGTQFLLIDNGKYCAYKTAEMSGVAVYNTGDDKYDECVQKIEAQTNCSDVVEMVAEGTAIQRLQTTVGELQKEIDDNKADYQNQIDALKNQNTNIQDFLKAHPIGSIYVSTDSTNPGNTYTGSTWVAYAGGRTLIGAGSTTDARGTYASFSGGQAGGEYYQALNSSNLPYHAHTYSTSANLENGWFDGPIYTGSCHVSGSTGEAGSHSHTLPGWVFQWGATFSNNVFNNSGDAEAGSTPGNALSTSQSDFNRTDGVGNHTHWIDLTGTISGSARGSVSGKVSVSGTTSYSGSNSQFNIQNPYIVVYMWKRTA